jgi:hypothetical protein
MTSEDQIMGLRYGLGCASGLNSAGHQLARSQGDSIWPPTQKAKNVLTRSVPAGSPPGIIAAPNAKRWRKLRISIAPAATPHARAARNKRVLQNKKAAARVVPGRRARFLELRSMVQLICGNASRNRRTCKAAFPKNGTHNRTARCGANDEPRHNRRTGSWVWPPSRLACARASSPFLSPEPLPPTFTPPVGSCDTPPAIPRLRPPPRANCTGLVRLRRPAQSD